MASKRFVAGLCVLGVAAAASAASAGPSPKPASLQMMDTAPIVVRGWSFESRERVTVLLNSGGEWQAKVKLATETGTFRIKFSASLDSCERLGVRAHGSRGSHARMLAPRYQIGCLTSGPGTHAGDTR
jgi:hypothetical protein